MSIRQAWLRVIYWTSLIAMVWWQMQTVHELGHILAALSLNEQIAEINLHPLQLSHTLLESHHYSTIFLWSGPLFGVLLPFALWQLSCFYKRDWSHVLRFYAGFCLIANGAYLGSAAISAVGDAKDLLNQRVPDYYLFTFGAITIPVGFWLWNGQGAKFGLGKNAEDVATKRALHWFVFTAVYFTGACLIFPIEFAAQASF